MTIARVLVSSATAAMLLVACSTIDPPAPFTKREAGTETTFSDGGAYDRCRVLARRFATDVDARVYGDPSGPQAVCLTLLLPEVPAADKGAVVFCVAGDLANVGVPSVHDLGPDLEQCAYCTDVQTNCTDAGASPTCTTSYAVVKGTARLVRFSPKPGAPVWIDIGGLEVARVVRRDAGIDVESRDCLFADGLTLQGIVQPGSCEGIEGTACTIAGSAASRHP